MFETPKTRLEDFFPFSNEKPRFGNFGEATEDVWASCPGSSEEQLSAHFVGDEGQGGPAGSVGGSQQSASQQSG